MISPAQIKILKHSKNRGKFLIKPLSTGFGITLGNSLRRVLISYLEGYAIYYIMINGVKHEFSYIDGVIENLTEIILNLKQIRLKLKSKSYKNIPEHFTIFLTKKKSKITAGDLCGSITCFEVLNPKLLILNKELDTNLKITLGIKKGVGYVPVETNKYLKKKIGKIPIDTIFSPIRNVIFKVETCEVNNSYDYDSLILDIRTDGSITPKNALKKASSILIQHFTLFFNGIFNGKKTELKIPRKYTDSKERIKYLYMQKLLNGLKFAKIKTWADLVKVNNFGIINKTMKKLGLDYGLDLSKYLSKYQMKISKKKKRIKNFREKMRQIIKLRNVIKRRKMTK
ncbi:DNA-directed RNA polymerase subunit alpha [Candidatus Karelsulcia muelleri]